MVCMLAAVWAAILWNGMAAPASLAGSRPNIVFVLTDDQGYGDLGCHGNPILKTPNLDRLHDASVRFLEFHVSPTCAPTRCALMTGRHEFRSGVTHTIFERERMSLKAVTIAQLLQKAGYKTGIFGKWHLGDEPEYQPNRRGFDEVFIHGAGGIGQTYKGSCGDAPNNKYFNPAILHNGVFEKTKGYCTDVFFNQAIEWINRQRQAKTPFFAYITPNAPHAPLDCPPEYESRYTNQVPKAAAAFFGMIANIDDNMGKLLSKLREWNIATNTLVIFMTDNGGTAGLKIYNAGMRSGKGTPYRGGTRVPAFFHWPGVLEPRAMTNLAAHLDIFPTLAELAGATIPADVAAKLEGRSLLPLFQNPQADWPDRILITHVGRWERGKAAESKYLNCRARNTRYEIVRAGKAPKQWELYDLLNDPGEKENIAASHPEIVQSLEKVYDAWWDSVQPDLINENLDGPPVNPFKELYWKQFPDERPKNIQSETK